jgi:Sugar transport protein
MHSSAFQLMRSRQLLFWLFLGGFVWVIGDLFQQFATKYLGIGRGIPLSNTNQFWGLAWGALVFGELASANRAHLALVLGGSVLMIVGALAISTAVASSRENTSRNTALARECDRYGLEYGEVLLAQSGDEFNERSQGRRWWDAAIVVAASCLFLWLGLNAVVPPLAMNLRWIAVLTLVLLGSLVGAGCALWRRTRFG